MVWTLVLKTECLRQFDRFAAVVSEMPGSPAAS